MRMGVAGDDEEEGGEEGEEESEEDEEDEEEEDDDEALDSQALQYADDGYFEQQQALRKRWGQAQQPVAVDPHAAMQAMDDVQRLEEELQALATLPRAPNQPLTSPEPAPSQLLTSF